MKTRKTPRALLTVLLSTAWLALASSYAANAEKVADVQNDQIDVTLFRGAANNTYFDVYWKALPVEGAETVEVEVRAVDLRLERDVTLHVEIYNPSSTFRCL